MQFISAFVPINCRFICKTYLISTNHSTECLFREFALDSNLIES